uniref:molybdopterin biosynthesis protein n=1 Tax=Pseudoerythrocladia kornmannii TaxID=753682 RepID=UPI001BEE46FC|nr:molybdopterin biosynthesis protein [Pseudoerythrocladia kornmannii]QUE28348.1 moeB [Pseudoerythrocladia kornmannii]UNJ16852.1 molybdopterin biosynthesis protein [Pseudoerythrocladia kornmannii]
MLYPELYDTQLSIEEYKRYSRHLVLDEIGLVGQKRLKNGKVLIVGIGGLGNLAVMYLAAAGIGSIGIVDYDLVNLSNLHRQILYNTNYVNCRKVKASYIQIQQLNHICNIVMYDTKLNLNNAVAILSEYDIIIDASDNFLTRYILNDISLLLHKPIVYGAILKTIGHISVFNYKGGANYRDLYPKQPSDKLIASCSEGGIVGGVAAIISTLQCNETLKILLGLDGVLSGEMIVYDFAKVTFRRININKQPSYTKKSILQNLKVLEKILFASNSQDKLFNFSDILPSDFQNISEINSYLLIDVRTSQEFGGFHLPGAKNIPIALISTTENVNFLSGQVKDGKIIIVYCQSNSRSLAASIILSKLKIKASRLKGGIAALGY